MMTKRNKKRTNRIWLVGVAALVILLITFGLMPKSTSVDTALVTRGPMEVILEDEGQTRVVDRFVVAAPVSGYTQRVGLKVGDSVEQGESILTIEPMPAEALNPQRRAEAEARIAAAEATLHSAQETGRARDAEATLASSELARVKALVEAGAATARELEVAQAQQSQAEAQRVSATFSVDVARHNVEAAKTALRYAGASSGGERIQVKSPIAGSVLAVHHESAGVVSAGTPIMEIGNPSRLEVAIDVLSQDATRIDPGMHVRFARWGGDGELTGTVRRVEPVGFTKISALGVEEQRVWILVDFTSDPSVWRRLGDGYRVIAQFILWASDDALQIPTSATFRTSGDWNVFVLENGKAVVRRINVGQRSGLRVQVVDGLAEGDQVVVHPPSDLQDGDRIKSRQ